MRRDDRSPEAQAYRRLYNTTRWKGKHGVRAQQLRKQPLCEMCLKANRFTVATVCDHVDPETKASPATFYDGPFQSLCDAHPWRCHSSRKQRIEARGYDAGCDVKGRPVDRLHPWNRP